MRPLKSITHLLFIAQLLAMDQEVPMTRELAMMLLYLLSEGS